MDRGRDTAIQDSSSWKDDYGIGSDGEDGRTGAERIGNDGQAHEPRGETHLHHYATVREYPRASVFILGHI